MQRKPGARSDTSESRESKMRSAAPHVLESAGYRVVGSRNARGMQLVNANGVDGEKITAWVKCAWAPKSHGHCAVQIDFPAPDRRPKDMLGVVRIVEEKAARAASLGATHLFLYAADDDVKRTFAAYLMPISAVSTATREAAQISPKLVKNGHSPCLYVSMSMPLSRRAPS